VTEITVQCDRHHNRPRFTAIFWVKSNTFPYMKGGRLGKEVQNIVTATAEGSPDVRSAAYSRKGKQLVMSLRDSRKA
jgi:hypothetical protein